MERKVVIRKSQHFFEKNSKIIKTIGLAVLVLSIPLTIYVLNQVQDLRQHASGELIPLTSNFPQTGCPVSFKDISASTDYAVPVYCQNQTYCITSGYDPATAANLGLPSPSFGGDIKTSRKFAIAFIARYHVKAIPAGDPRHWDMVTPTGNVFTDVKPGAEILAAEIETAKKYGFVYGQDNGDGTFSFKPEDDWVYGFHGIDRSEYFDASGNFKWGALGTITRGQFLKQEYAYGIDPAHQDYKLCMIAPTVPPVAPTTPPPPPTATPVPAVACNSACTTDAQCSLATGGCTVCKPSVASTPIIDFTKLTGSLYPKNFAAKLPDGSYREPTYPTAPYRLAVECLNKAYSVVQGYSIATCPAGSACTDLNPNTSPPEGYVGGELPTTRKFAVAFIARYHVDAIAATDARHWNWVTQTGTVFKDVPTSTDLGKEIETAYSKGFISGASCSSFYAIGDPFYSSDPSVKCFDPEGNWLYGFKGIEKNDYFSGTTPINPWNFTIKRGDFLQQLYTFGTSAAHPDLAKCMTTPGSSGSCQAPAAPPTPACGTSCNSDQNCSQAANGCTTCNSTTMKCSVAACGVSCSRDSDCAGAATKDGCVSCLGGKCSPPFNPAACKCDGIDATAIGSGQAVTFSAYSKVEGTDISQAIVKGVNIRVFRGGAEVANKIAESGFISPTVIETTSTKIRYKTDWKYTVPADANNGDMFRVQADIQCVPKVLAAVPAQTIARTEDKGLFAVVIHKITEPVRAVLGLTTSPTPIPPKSLQISSFYPGQIVEKSCNYFRFVIKR
jgi:hypothetical protein